MIARNKPEPEAEHFAIRLTSDEVCVTGGEVVTKKGAHFWLTLDDDGWHGAFPVGPDSDAIPMIAVICPTREECCSYVEKALVDYRLYRCDPISFQVVPVRPRYVQRHVGWESIS